MELTKLKTLTAAALLAATTAASAGTVPFSMVSGGTGTGVDVSLTIQESTVPGHDYDFVVSNNSLMGIVTGVYFEIDWNSMLNGLGTATNATDMVRGDKDADVPGWEGTKSSHTVEPETNREWVGRGYLDVTTYDMSHGIEEGGSEMFSFSAGSGISLSDITDMLGTDGYGVAVRLQGLTEDDQAAGWGEADQVATELLFVQASSLVQTGGDEGGDNGNNGGDTEVVSAPSPTAALAGLVVAGIAGLRRRRK